MNKEEQVAVYNQAVTIIENFIYQAQNKYYVLGYLESYIENQLMYGMEINNFELNKLIFEIIYVLIKEYENEQ